MRYGIMGLLVLGLGACGGEGATQPAQVRDLPPPVLFEGGDGETVEMTPADSGLVASKDGKRPFFNNRWIGYCEGAFNFGGFPGTESATIVMNLRESGSVLSGTALVERELQLDGVPPEAFVPVEGPVEGAVNFDSSLTLDILSELPNFNLQARTGDSDFAGTMVADPFGFYNFAPEYDCVFRPVFGE